MEYDSALEYYIALDKIDTTLENYPYYNKGAFIKFYRTNSIIDTVFIGKDGEIIESFVDDDKVSFDETFILAAQKPLLKICECNRSYCATDSYDRENTSGYQRCKDALEKSNFYQYWIINKIQNAVYGPFSKEEFLQKQEELKVSKELKLKE